VEVHERKACTIRETVALVAVSLEDPCCRLNLQARYGLGLYFSNFLEVSLPVEDHHRDLLPVR